MHGEVFFYHCISVFVFSVLFFLHSSPTTDQIAPCPVQDSHVTQQKPGLPCGPPPQSAFPLCLHLPLLSHHSLYFTLASVLPQGLCTCYCLFLETSPFSFPSHLAIHMAHLSPSSSLYSNVLSGRLPCRPSLFYDSNYPPCESCFIPVVVFFIVVITTWPYVIHSLGFYVYCLSPPLTFKLHRSRDLSLDLFPVSPVPGTELVLSKYLLNE